MSSVRFICGTQDIHRELENRLTEFLGTEDTLLFPSCMDANAGFFEACLNEQDVMIADRLVHASIVDGMRLCKAMLDTYKHSDMAHLEEKLQEHMDKRSRMIITDGVFSHGQRRLGARLLPEIPEPRADYLKEWWNVVNWAEVNKRFQASRK
jgi:glycine C-acetyltransferase